MERCLASSVAKAMEDKCEAEGVATPGALPRLRGRLGRSRDPVQRHGSARFMG
jgi:hypothetical protein